MLSIWTGLRRKRHNRGTVTLEAGTARHFHCGPSAWLLLSGELCSSSLGRQQKRDGGQNTSTMRYCGRKYGAVSRGRATTRSRRWWWWWWWWSTHSCRPLNRLCVASDCASALRSHQQRGSAFKPELRRASGPPRPNTPGGNHQRHRRGGCYRTTGGGKKPHSGTQSSHLKFTDRAVSGAEQERLKM